MRFSLRRITSDGSYIPQIDGLRFVAILSVVLFHLYAHPWAVDHTYDLSHIADLARRGVELFFVISGFILGLPFARAARNKSKVNLKRYFLRRVTRLEPPYIIVMIGCAAGMVAKGKFTLHQIIPHLLASIFYVHNIVYKIPSVMNAVAWSLEVEVQFYCLAPVLALLFYLQKTLWRWIILLGSILYFAWVNAHIAGALYLPYYLSYFLSGFLIVELYLWSESWQENRIWDLTALAWPLVWMLSRSLEPFVLPFLFVVLFMGVFHGVLSSKVFSISWITNIGGMCYSIYLCHMPPLGYIARVTEHLHFSTNFWVYFVLQCVVQLPIIFVICVTYFLLVERPCMDKYWPQKLYAKLSGRKNQLTQFQKEPVELKQTV